jgi:hypothetical protein
MAEIRRPRPFSIACGIVFMVVGVASVMSSWTEIHAGTVGGLALLLSGLAALLAIASRRAPSAVAGPE